MLGSIMPLIRGEGHVVQEFIHSSGIHYEPLGKMYLSNRQYTLAVTVDLGALVKRAELVAKHLQEMQRLCHEAGYAWKGSDLINGQWVRDFDKTLDYVRDLVEGADMRKRRGLINGLGTVAKSLFGVMDADDAQAINARLSHLEDGQEKYFRTAGHGIELINATVFQLERAERTFELNEKHLATGIAEAKKQFNEGLDRLMAKDTVKGHANLVDTIREGVEKDVEGVRMLVTKGRLLDSGIGLRDGGREDTFFSQRGRSRGTGGHIRRATTVQRECNVLLTLHIPRRTSDTTRQ